MSKEADIALIKRQEIELVFSEFNELVAHSLGERIRERALREKLVIVVDIRTWDRQLYFMSLPGTTSARLAPRESGFDNLTFAGDWTRTRINGGSVEAAVESGQEAARAIRERHGVA